MSETMFRFFSPTLGHAVRRYGTDVLIGATRTTEGFEIDPNAVVAIPTGEVDRFAKEYHHELTNKTLVERTEADYAAAQAAKKAAREAKQAERKADPTDEPKE